MLDVNLVSDELDDVLYVLEAVATGLSYAAAATDSPFLALLGEAVAEQRGRISDIVKTLDS